jgi:hypothetical protein
MNVDLKIKLKYSSPPIYWLQLLEILPKKSVAPGEGFSRPDTIPTAVSAMGADKGLWSVSFRSVQVI